MYFLPKVRKTPIKPKFIITSPRSSVKPLSQVLEVFQTNRVYNNKWRFFSRVNRFCAVQSNKPV